ncbi:hypothetical protein E9549_17460 [Blastococcus sp. MG754426]|uniref:hypothetical protein n=1 Tax=unclassified Blastococcus TaxID=2619396 RepID=UPI001EF11FA3|nr:MULTISPECIES: hypothetical protein [unclassified Blastococcus]MCF6509176.1 hypothetical protein [Blastococcus sp. MG754426]MCF6513733.1 hypothetical protein [Blastococcus sp. MG754427]
MSTPTGARCPSDLVATALLWDLDNVAVPLTQMNSFAQTLSALVPPTAPKVAAANWRAFRLYGDDLRAHGIRVLCGSRDPAGADGVLLRQAKRLRRGGATRLLVASNDHVFARLATRAEVHVVTRTGDLVSGRLQAVAASITVLAREEDGGWAALPAA